MEALESAPHASLRLQRCLQEAQDGEAETEVEKEGTTKSDDVPAGRGVQGQYVYAIIFPQPTAEVLATKSDPLWSGN